MPSFNTTYSQHTPQSSASKHKRRLVSKGSETQKVRKNVSDDLETNLCDNVGCAHDDEQNPSTSKS